jgi:hypothetical protein
MKKETKTLGLVILTGVGIAAIINNAFPSAPKSTSYMSQYYFTEDGSVAVKINKNNVTMRSRNNGGDAMVIPTNAEAKKDPQHIELNYFSFDSIDIPTNSEYITLTSSEDNGTVKHYKLVKDPEHSKSLMELDKIEEKFED